MKKLLAVLMFAFAINALAEDVKTSPTTDKAAAAKKDEKKSDSKSDAVKTESMKTESTKTESTKGESKEMRK